MNRIKATTCGLKMVQERGRLMAEAGDQMCQLTPRRPLQTSDRSPALIPEPLRERQGNKAYRAVGTRRRAARHQKT